jgi:hypothetical protein
MTEHDSSRDSTTQKRPKWKQLAWMIGGGIVLAIGGCGFFLSDIGAQVRPIGAIAFLVGVLLCLAGCVRGMISFFRRN